MWLSRLPPVRDVFSDLAFCLAVEFCWPSLSHPSFNLSHSASRHCSVVSELQAWLSAVICPRVSPLPTLPSPPVTFPGDTVAENAPASQDTDETGFSPWVRKVPGEGNGDPPQYSCLGKPMDRGAWRSRGVHGVAESGRRQHTRMHTHSPGLKRCFFQSDSLHSHLLPP